MADQLGATLVALKHRLQNSRDFMVPWGFFHDEVAMVPAHVLAGHKEANPRLSLCLAAIGGHLFKRPCAAPEVEFIHVPEHRFWHGSCAVGGRVAVCFFFDDIVQGLAGFMRSLADPRVDLARLTWAEVPADLPAWGGVAGTARRN